MFSVNLSDSHSLILAGTGRLLHSGGGDGVPVLDGAHLRALLERFPSPLEREYLRALREACEIGEERASRRTRGFWAASKRAVCEAIQLLQGDAGEWGWKVAAKLPTMPQWAALELVEQGSPLNSGLRSLYRCGYTVEEAAREVVSLVALRQRSDEMQEVA